MNESGKKAVKDSERLETGPLQRALVMCMTVENNTAPWAIADHSRKLIRYACQALSGCSPASPAINVTTPIATRTINIQNVLDFGITIAFVSFSDIAVYLPC